MPQRKRQYSWIGIIQAAIAELLSGWRGSFATEEVRQDEALLKLLGLDDANEPTLKMAEQ